MSEQTKIAWCDSTVNFWSGCTKVSAGCANCYAETLSKRGLPAIGGWGKGVERKRSKSAVKDALAFNRKPWICDHCGKAFNDHGDLNGNNHCIHEGKQPSAHRRRIFSLSLGDWLDNEVPIEWLAEMLDTIRQCSDVTWILCTKRPENFFGDEKSECACRIGDAQDYANQTQNHELFTWLCSWANGIPPANIILLTSVENQEQADKRIPKLLKIPAACRGLSLEPLLASVTLDSNYFCQPQGLRWLIIGGESGPNARPCNVDWIRSLVQQGKAAGVATFVKQLGAFPFDDSKFQIQTPELRDKKGGDPAEWAADLRVQEWPKLEHGR